MATEAEYMGDCSLLGTFNNGQRKKVDLTSLLVYHAYEELRDTKEFIRYGIHGIVCWTIDAKIASYVYNIKNLLSQHLPFAT